MELDGPELICPSTTVGGGAVKYYDKNGCPLSSRRLPVHAKFSWIPIDKKEDEMATVRVEDLWEVFPDLRVEDIEFCEDDYANEIRASWADKVKRAAQHSRDKSALKELRNNKEDK